MPLGSRDVWLVLRARDYASRVIQQVGREFGGLQGAQQAAMQRQVALGSALATGGALLTGMGAAGLKAYEGMGKAALDYNKEAALTLTQVDQVGVSLDQIKEIGKQVAVEVPAAFKEMQPALYDIFSSMNVNTKEAQTLLTGFSKAAVAGNVDIQSAARETIALMNAYQIPISKVNDVLDFQFQLVRKGVGTYAEFASTIGRAIPSAVKAGQSYQELGGALAFATRNGLSTAMAATAVARAMDLMSKPAVVQRLAKMGISALNMDGSFRPLSATLGDLSKKLQGMSDMKRIEVLDALFKGQGNAIQARRFLDLALKNADALKAFVGDMNNSKGALSAAYDIMFKQGANQAQLLSNNFEVLKTTLGDAVLPVFNLVVAALIQIVQWFNNLSPEVKKTISIIGLLFFALMTLVGIGATVAGAILLISAAATALGLTTLGLILAFGEVIVAIAAVAAGAYYLYTHWSDVIAWFQKLIDIFQKGGFNTALAFVGQQFKALWDVHIYPGLKSAYDKISGWLNGTLFPFFEKWGPKLADGLWGWIQTNGPVILGWLNDRLNDIGTWVTSTAIPWLETNAPLWVQALWGWIVDSYPVVLSYLQAALDAVGAWIIGTAWPYLVANFPGWMNALWGWIVLGASLIGEQMWVWLQALGDWITNSALPWLTEKMKELVPALSTWILTEGIPKLIELGLDLAMALTNWIITDAIPYLATHLPVWLAFLVGFILTVVLPALIKALGAVARDAMQGMLNVLEEKGGEVLTWFLGLPMKILTALGDLAKTLDEQGMKLITGLLGGIMNAAVDLFLWFMDLPGNLLDFFDDAGTWLWQIGVDFITGLLNGMKSVWGTVTSWMGEAAKDAVMPWRLAFKVFSPSLVMTDIGQYIMQGLQNGLITGYGPVLSFIGKVSQEMVQRFLTARNAAEIALVKTAADFVSTQLMTEQERVNNFLTAMAAAVSSKVKQIQDQINSAKMDAAILNQIINDNRNSQEIIDEAKRQRDASNSSGSSSSGGTSGGSSNPDDYGMWYFTSPGGVTNSFFGTRAQAEAAAGGSPISQTPGGDTPSTPTDTSSPSIPSSGGGSSGSSGGGSGIQVDITYNITIEGSLLGIDEFDKHLQEQLDEHDQALLDELELRL